MCLAEDAPLADDSVDLVTVAQALHWFDRPRFYDEVRRVARGRSVLAVWSYGLATVSPAVDGVVERLYGEIVGPYWPAERRIVEAGYATIDFPFREIAPPAFSMTAQWDFQQLIGYLGTWSSVVRYRERQGSDPLALVADDLRVAWGDGCTARPVEWPLRLRLGYVE